MKKICEYDIMQSERGDSGNGNSRTDKDAYTVTF